MSPHRRLILSGLGLVLAAPAWATAPGVGTRMVLEAPTAHEAGAARPVVGRRALAAGSRNARIDVSGRLLAIDAPGVTNAGMLGRYLTTPARLTLRLVDRGGEGLPSGDQWMDDARGHRIAVRRAVAFDGAHIVRAAGITDINGLPAVDFILDEVGARRFGDLTSANVGEWFAIMLDGRCLSTVAIVTPITDGTCRISGDFTAEEAHELGELLQSGALPATLRIVETSPLQAGRG